ncbi:DNA helicase protein [Dioscorea alata]|uniref:DNA helicase protein n=1 Tax=Dioscorea alata TaxID=55571 RepID=A0ACB7WPY4_DIOAL|nr:DNA helicase protein [Dioscorea alata]
MVAHSYEFGNIVVREEEQEKLETLLRVSCPLEVKGGATDKHRVCLALLDHLPRKLRTIQWDMK